MAIEEQLRITTPIQNLYRYTRADYQVGEVTIPDGSRVLLSFGAANRDPLAFDHPDEYRADRNPRMHVGFGYGAHMCLGAPLARMEAQAVLRELVSQVSRISADDETLWSTNSSLRGPTHIVGQQVSQRVAALGRQGLVAGWWGQPCKHRLAAAAELA
jgi:cytochrome P450